MVHQQVFELSITIGTSKTPIVRSICILQTSQTKPKTNSVTTYLPTLGTELPFLHTDLPTTDYGLPRHLCPVVRKKIFQIQVQVQVSAVPKFKKKDDDYPLAKA